MLPFLSSLYEIALLDAIQSLCRDSRFGKALIVVEHTNLFRNVVTRMAQEPKATERISHMRLAVNQCAA
jgi:hypothetical protein